MFTSTESSIRTRSITLALLVHGLLFLLFLFFMIHIPIPPFPEAAGGNGGVLVNIGIDETGSGDIQPMAENDLASEKPQKEQMTKANEENIATQDNETVAVMHKTKVDKKKNKKVLVKESEKEVVQKDEVKIVIPVRVPNAAAMYKGANNNSKSQGIAGGKGDQGDPNGDPNSKYYGKNGNGGNGPGTGNGNGPGTGDGNNGFSNFVLKGRKIVQRPVSNDKSQETGRVVVEITVDKFGKVTHAIPGARGTTTSSVVLYSAATKSAYTAKFTANANAAEEQKGTITFVFTVQ